MQRVAEQRIAFLTDPYAELGLPDQRAQMLSRLAYATYIGLMRISPEAPAPPLRPEDLEALTDEVTRALIVRSESLMSFSCAMVWLSRAEG